HARRRTPPLVPISRSQADRGARGGDLGSGPARCQQYGSCPPALQDSGRGRRDLDDGAEHRARSLGDRDASPKLSRLHRMPVAQCARWLMTLLMLLSGLLVLLLLATLAYALVKIAQVLDVIGGSPTSYLAKLRLGLRAIERETSHLPAALGKVNGGL